MGCRRHKRMSYLCQVENKQSQAATELNLSAWQIRRLLRGLKEQGDKIVVHGLRGRPSNRRLRQGDSASNER